MRDLVRRNPKFFLFVAVAAFALRIFFVFRLPGITNDSFIYGDIAKNWLQHGIYGLTAGNHVSPTLIRLPGYPAFLALVFRIFGVDHYRAVLFLQVLVDIGTCLLICDLTRRIVSSRSAKAAFVLAALCPFFASYAAAALTETWEIFFTTLALDLAVIAIAEEECFPFREWIGCGLAIGAAILLRPDGGLLLGALAVFLLGWCVLRAAGGRTYRRQLLGAAIVALIALAPLVPWTLRNLHTLHRFQPLAPRYANEEDEFVPMGFNRWVKTWIADYTSVEEIYWNVPGDVVDVAKLPSRAFDSDAQRRATAEVLDQYNAQLHMSPELDARLAALAEERVHDHPLRYYVWLPVVRVVDMWMRPRTELLQSDPRWWDFNDVPIWSVVAVLFGAINLVYVVAALVSIPRVRPSAPVALLLTFVVLRSAFLGTLENPETRYTLEMYPVVIFIASFLFMRRDCVEKFQKP